LLIETTNPTDAEGGALKSLLTNQPSVLAKILDHPAKADTVSKLNFHSAEVAYARE